MYRYETIYYEIWTYNRYENNDIIDEVIISFMKGPRSFTAEDTIEINCHGGVISTNKVLEECN